MSEINFLQLVRVIREESACLGHPMSKREATRQAGKAIQDEKFKTWCAQIDAGDVAELGSIAEHHSDTTARKAIRRYLRAQFNTIMKEQAA